MGDRELCMAAVTYYRQALEFVSEEMKGDRELCTAAVAQNGTAFKYMSEELRNDEGIALMTLECHLKRVPFHKGKLEYVMFQEIWEAFPNHLQQSEEVRRAAGL